MLNKTVSFEELTDYKVDKPCIRIIDGVTLNTQTLDEGDFCALDDLFRGKLQGNKQLPSWIFELLPEHAGRNLGDYNGYTSLASLMQVSLEELLLNICNMSKTDFVEITHPAAGTYRVFMRASLGVELCNKLLHGIAASRRFFFVDHMIHYLNDMAAVRQAMVFNALLDRGRLLDKEESYRNFIGTDSITASYSSPVCSGGGYSPSKISGINFNVYYEDAATSSYGCHIANYGFGCIRTPMYWADNRDNDKKVELPGETDQEKQKLFCEKHNIHCATLGEAVSPPCNVAQTTTVYNFKVGKEKQYD